MVPKQKPERKLHLKDVVTIVGILSFVGGLYVWANTAVVVPTVLEQTRKQTREMIDQHAAGTHVESFTQREGNRLFDRLFKRLDDLEAAVRERK